MKNKIWSKKPYRKLIHKIFFQTLVMLFLAFLAVNFLRSAGQGKVANVFTKYICSWFSVDWETAANLYWVYVRQRLDNILIVTMFLFFLLFFRLLLSWFTKYFDEIINGVDQLSGGQKQRIIMSPELGFMEEKLNQVKEELERSAKAEREAEERKNDLVVYLAHDIKTPLTSVIGYLNLLDEIPDMPMPQKAEYVHITLEKAYRLEKLINEFFEITRYNLQTAPLQKETVDLCYMMVQIVDEAYPQLAENEKKVSMNIPEDLTVNADSEKMARVFNNILKNAISYSVAGSQIEIYGERKGGTVVVRFENDGTIPKEKLGRIFEKFYRMDQARQTATGGAGLGLAIAKDIVLLHGGTITAGCHENRTVFTIILPDKSTEILNK